MNSDKRIIDTITNNVNLTGYGVSNGWLGYCERKDPFRIETAYKLIDIFLSCFDYRNLCLVSSLVKIKEREIDVNLDLSQKLKSMEDQLIIDEYLELVCEDESQGDFSDFIVNPSFKVFHNFSKEILKVLSCLVFADSSIDGHCFFLHDKLKLIIYPHEDTGYGFISFGFSEEGLSSFHKLMLTIDSEKEFKAFIK